MDGPNDLEIAALQRIAEEHPEATPTLMRWIRSCSVSRRENTGGGFFITLALQGENHSALSLHSPLGDAWVKVEGLRYGICCLLFLTDGYPTLLEGYSVAGEDTSQINFNLVKFALRRGPPTVDNEWK
jgi:hypothetical protein